MKLRELKKLIIETVNDSFSTTNDSKVHMGKAYRWKESVMQSVQDGVRANSGVIESQEEYEKIIDQEIQKIREDFDLTLSMVGRALYQIPFQAFKSK